ncbi:1-deoxy-D-xylulose-5-phosphate synthase [Lachnoclostridium sp. An181]|uniref:1-deoxy-D-xylulose-5-phosphate synthase n=1 Tax=Lachnoclostridium sp. An181 TaxID=1965575 RepID=UPI000B3783BF|nr:1-deoxy-D-xylulose-5-phosphate synthase [Lachnoclostridium sp. An181]OUP51198.1 1-deoxy-D-xylulose-5-phosphate synthase [Lachnoclostridium sp. An181]
MVLEKIQKENDIKKLDRKQLPILAKEIRHFLIENISRTGGHLASNLGVVELTMALHLMFCLPQDRMIWDVGHQSYTHKILTGRKDGFEKLRTYGGMSGFPKRKESDCDAFDTGHSSTSISAGIGYVKARELLDEENYVISIIGDGALTGGMAYEALNNASQLDSNFIIVLNDNRMSISENVGGMSKYLDGLRTANAYTGLKREVEHALNKVPVAGRRMVHQIKKTKNSIKQLFVPGMFFEDMGITYLGPVDGHDVKALCRAFQEAKKMNQAVLVHVLTKKGKGYRPAEKAPSRYHGTGPFDIRTGKVLEKKDKPSYTDIFGKVLYDEAAKDKRIAAVTAAMADGTGLASFRRRYPKRFFDVGIAEGHAVTFCAGLAAGGMKPVFAVYSSFLQRGFDQLIHDVCLQNLPVLFAVDRAGLVGSDGETHQGIFDLSFLSMIPNMTVMSPKNGTELADMVRFALKLDSPCAIRYPRGEAYDGYKEFSSPVIYGKSEWIYEEEDIVLISVGHMFETCANVREKLKEIGYNCSLVNARFVKPLDEEMLQKAAKDHRLLVTVEENVKNGGFGEHVAAWLNATEANTSLLSIAVPDAYIEHGNVQVLRKESGLDEESVTRKIIMAYIGIEGDE